MWSATSSAGRWAPTTTMYQRPPLLGTRLGIDYGNAGTAVVEMFVMAQVMADITAILLTGGYGMGGGKEGVHVSKVQLVGVLISLLSGRRIKIVPVLSESKQLRKELEGFQVKITRALNESFEAAKERIHDDLVIALALAGYIGEVIGMMSCGGVTDVRITPPKQPHETYPDRRELQIVGKRNMPQLRWNLWG